MLPRSSKDILSSASKKRGSKPPPPGLLSFALPPASRVYGVSGTSEDHHSEPLLAPGSSQHLYGATVPSPTTVSFSIGPLYAHGQQEGTRRNRISRSRSLVDAVSTLASSYSCIHLCTNKCDFISSRSSSDYSGARLDVTNHRVRMSRAERITKVLGLLKDGGLGPFDLVLSVLDANDPDYAGYRNELYKDKSSKLPSILDSILTTDAGKQKLWSWMQPHALQIVCGVIDEEMDSVTKAEVLSGIAAITPEFIKSWTGATTCEQAPFLTEVLLRAAQTSQAKEKNKKKHPEAVCIGISLSCLIHSNADVLTIRCVALL